MLKRLFALFSAALIVQCAMSQTAIRIEAGGGPTFGWVNDSDRFTTKAKKGVASNGQFGLFLELPVSSKKPFFIETGLAIGAIDNAFRINSVDVQVDYHSYLRVPLKLDYRMMLGKRASLTFGAGTYADMALSRSEHMGSSNLQIGLTPSIMFRYRKFNIGVSYYNPIIYNGIKTLNKNSLLVTCGFTFNLKKNWGGWKWVGAGTIAAATIATTVATTQQTATGADHESIEQDSENQDRTQKTKRTRKDKYGVSDVQSSRTSGNTYREYVDQISRMKTYGPVDMRQLKQIQKKMKEIREKNNKDSRNFKISKNELEDWDGTRD